MNETLADVRPGEHFEISDIADPNLHARLLRLGFLDGPVTCRNRLRRGPVIVSRDGMDLALGSSVAHDIEVAQIAETGSETQKASEMHEA